MKTFSILLSIILLQNISAQSSAENSVFKFLNIPISARHNYLGKAAIASPGPQMDLALANPALLEFHSKYKLMATSSFYFTSQFANVSYSHNNFKYDIPFVVGASVLNYGKQIKTDVYGNEYGDYYPHDISAYIAASKTYENYKFGFAAKFAYGNYINAVASGIAFDASMLYRDEDAEMYATLILKNIGWQFVGQKTERASMPFDIQAAFSKKLKHMPLRFTIAAQELYRWSAATSSESYGLWPDNNEYVIDRPGIIGSIMSHLVFGAELNFGKTVKIGANYDVKRGIENSFTNLRGMTGLGLGFGVYTRKFDFGYSFSKFGPIGVNHAFTFSINTKEWGKR